MHRLENLDTDFVPPEAAVAAGAGGAATPMKRWDEANGDRSVRLAFSNEPVERLAVLRERVERALGTP